MPEQNVYYMKLKQTKYCVLIVAPTTEAAEAECKQQYGQYCGRLVTRRPSGCYIIKLLDVKGV